MGRTRVTAMILDVTHRLWLVDGKLPAFDVPPGVRPLAALLAATPRAGFTLAHPLGLLESDDGTGVLFAFLVDADAATSARPSGAWLPLPVWARDAKLAPAWQLYVDALLGGWSPPTRELDVCYFGNEPALAARLAHLVIKGEKHGTTGSVDAAERDGWSIPAVGTVSIVTDGFGVPLCAIRTERSERGTFADATEEIARAEGEGDRSLADWREGHRRYFEAEAARAGVRFDDASPVFFEYFRVLRVLRRDRPAAEAAAAGEWLAAVAGSAHDAIVGKSTTGEITFWNPAAERLCGYTAAEALGRPLHELLPPLSDADDEAIHRSILDGRALTEREQVRLGKDRRPVAVGITVAPVQAADGTPLGWAMIMRDVSERQRIEAQLRHADRLATLGTLAASIVHEMSGPLTYVTLSLEELAEPPDGERSVEERLADVREGVQRVVELVRDLRMFARADDGRRQLVELRDVVQTALRMSAAAMRAHAPVAAELDTPAPVRADPARLAQVFINLLINAADAVAGLETRPRRLSVAVRAVDDASVAVEVTDNGHGIAPEHLTRVFDAFFTTKPPETGTGLGLAISRQIVEHAGGRIEVASTLGEGTTFRVVLPRATDAPG